MRSADVIVVGGGVMGASAVWHLASRGASVLLLEAAPLLGTGSTGANAGGFRQQFSTAVNIRLSQLSIALLERFEEELGQPVDLNYCGYLFLLDSEADEERFRANLALQHELGVPSAWVTPEEIGSIAPLVDLQGIVGGTFCPGDGIVDPSGILQGYAAGAARAGARIVTGARVEAAEVAGGRVVSVKAGGETYSAGAYLIAAGPWSRGVGRLFGLELPIDPVKRQIAVTSPLPGIGRDFPFVIDFSRSLYFHYESGGILTGMSRPDQPVGFDTLVDEEWRLAHLEAAVERLPLLEHAGIASEWAGLYEVTPDDQPILGRLPQLENLYSCAGFSGHGLMHGPAAGLLLAEEIVDGRATTIDIAPLRWRTFASDTGGEYNVI